MIRFDIGKHVRVVGGIAEHYPGVTAVIIAVSSDRTGLAHLNRYRVCLSNGNEETFYEFQLAATDSAPGQSWRNQDGFMSA